MTITITGGTGFIGSHLCSLLEKQGHKVIILTRKPEKYSHNTNPVRSYMHLHREMDEAVSGSEVIVNLAGESLIAKRWTRRNRKRMMSSRVDTTNRIADAIEKADKKPALLISVSGSNYYGDSGDRELTEQHPPGDDFLSEICVRWEEASKRAEKYGVRVVNPRLGVVLEKDGGALKMMLPAFRLFVGGPLGSGRQYFPWIHVYDLCRSFLFVLDKQDLAGPYNAAAPQQITMNELARSLGKVLHRPSFFRVPEFVLKLLLGKGSRPVTSSIRLKPEVLQKQGFEFEFPEIEAALNDILKK